MCTERQPEAPATSSRLEQGTKPRKTHHVAKPLRRRTPQTTPTSPKPRPTPMRKMWQHRTSRS
nr:MAG TPA: hypothetical protein [Caudoviricetes sp.]